MIVYNYDPDTGAYLYSASEADADPMEPGKWLIPANATEKVPPSVADSTKQQQVFRDGRWVVENKPVEPAIHQNIAAAPPEGMMWPRMSIKEALKGGVS